MTAPDCPDPPRCDVPSPRDLDLRRLRTVAIAAGTPLHTVYRRAQWPALFGSSGRARFSPLVVDGAVVPTLYLAATQTVALLETAFHDVHQRGSRTISVPLDLSPRGLATVSTPERLVVIDLRDDSLARLGLTREQLVTTTADHYPCTREWAEVLHARRVGRATPVGIVWRSRVAELASADSVLFDDLLTLGSDVLVVFGDRVSTDPADWRPGPPHYDDLSVGQGRILAEEMAEQLDATIVPI